MADVKLLSEATNCAVVHLPGRVFPGIVVQGDSLNALIADMREVAAEAHADERVYGLDAVIQHLTEMQTHYEAVLKQEGIPLPYSGGNDS
jgi:predicted RNase H-like HicB family nuclease